MACTHGVFMSRDASDFSTTITFVLHRAFSAEMRGTLALAAPAKTSPAVLNELGVALAKILKRKDIARKMILPGGDLAPLNSAHMDKYARQQIDFWGQKICSAGIEPQWARDSTNSKSSFPKSAI